MNYAVAVAHGVSRVLQEMQNVTQAGPGMPDEGQLNDPRLFMGDQITNSTNTTMLIMGAGFLALATLGSLSLVALCVAKGCRQMRDAQTQMQKSNDALDDGKVFLEWEDFDSADELSSIKSSKTESKTIHESTSLLPDSNPGSPLRFQPGEGRTLANLDTPNSKAQLQQQLQGENNRRSGKISTMQQFK